MDQLSHELASLSRLLFALALAASALAAIQRALRSIA